jgi:hypothetical protein
VSEVEGFFQFLFAPLSRAEDLIEIILRKLVEIVNASSSQAPLAQYETQ